MQRATQNKLLLASTDLQLGRQTHRIFLHRLRKVGVGAGFSQGRTDSGRADKALVHAGAHHASRRHGVAATAQFRETRGLPAVLGASAGVGMWLLGALGWVPEHSFGEGGLPATVDWYASHRDWWEPIKSGAYRAYYEEQYANRLKA